MPDISKLADDLIALNNASPRSPTKEEIVALLQGHDAVRPDARQPCPIDHTGTDNGDHVWVASIPNPHREAGPRRCLCGAIDDRSVAEREEAIRVRYEKHKAELKEALAAQEPPLEPKGAPIHRDADIVWPTGNAPTELRDMHGRRMIPVRDWTDWVPVDAALFIDVPVGPNLTGKEASLIGADSSDRAAIMVRGGEVKFRKQHTYRVTQAQLEKAVSCDEGHDYDPVTDECHRCGKSQHGMSSSLHRQLALDAIKQLGVHPEVKPHAEGAEF